MIGFLELPAVQPLIISTSNHIKLKEICFFFIFILFSAYVKKAAELERAQLASLSSSPIPDLTSSTSPHSSIPDSLSATGVN